MNVVVDTTWRQGYVIVVNVVVVVNKGLQLDVTLSPRGEKGSPIVVYDLPWGGGGGSRT